MSDHTPERSNATSVHAVIDRTEDNDIAVLLVGDDESLKVDWPVALLPEGAQDGDHLQITIKLDEASRQAGEKRVAELQNRLLKRSNTPDKKDFKL